MVNKTLNRGTGYFETSSSFCCCCCCFSDDNDFILESFLSLNLTIPCQLDIRWVMTTISLLRLMASWSRCGKCSWRSKRLLWRVCFVRSNKQGPLENVSGLWPCLEWRCWTFFNPSCHLFLSVFLRISLCCSLFLCISLYLSVLLSNSFCVSVELESCLGGILQCFLYQLVGKYWPTRKLFFIFILCGICYMTLYFLLLILLVLFYCYYCWYY